MIIFGYDICKLGEIFMKTFIDILNSMPGAAAQGIIWGIMAIGVYITYKILDVADLTVDGSICTGGAVCVMLIMAGCPVPLAILAAFVAGMLSGLITGLFHTLMGIPAILAGILTQISLYSINLKILGKANQAINASKYDLLVSLRDIKSLPSFKVSFLGMNITIFNIFENTIIVAAIFAIVLIAVLYWFFGTERGCALRATGSNHNMSRAQGINTGFNTVLGLMLSNGIVALSGALLAQYQGYADVQMGRGAIVIGLAAVVIGNSVFGKIFKNFALQLLGVVFGGIIYYIVYQTVYGLGVDPDLLKLLSAIVVAVFLGVPYWKKRYFTKPKIVPSGEVPETAADKN